MRTLKAAAIKCAALLVVPRAAAAVTASRSPLLPPPRCRLPDTDEDVARQLRKDILKLASKCGLLYRDHILTEEVCSAGWLRALA